MMINKELCLQMFHSYQWQHAKLKYTIFANLEIKNQFICLNHILNQKSSVCVVSLLGELQPIQIKE